MPCEIMGPAWPAIAAALAVVLAATTVRPRRAAAADGGGDDDPRAEPLGSLRAKAEEFDLEAQFLLAARLWAGEEGPAGREEGIAWLMRAAEGGHPEARHNQGMATLKGIGVKPAADQGVFWLTLAASDGVPESRLALDALGIQAPAVGSLNPPGADVRPRGANARMIAEIFPDGVARSGDDVFRRGSVPGQAALRVSRLLAGKGRAAEARKWLLAAAEAGNPEAAGEAGVAGPAGRPKRPNPAEVAAGLRLVGTGAAETGPAGAVRAASLLAGPLPGDVRLVGARPAGGDPRRIHPSPIPPADPDPVADDELDELRDAADEGDMAAAMRLGRALVMDDRRDSIEGLEWLRRAAEAGDPRARKAMVDGLLGGAFEGIEDAFDPVETASLLRGPSDAGDPRARLLLAEALLDGLDLEGRTSWKAETVARRLMASAAELGVPEAQLQIGQCLLFGGFGRDNPRRADVPKGLDWILKAVAAGLPAAKYVLGGCYAEGEVLPEDKSLAYKWIREAAQDGYPDAQRDLGGSYLDGDYTEVDSAAALHWLQRAALQGSSDALFDLGHAYERGEAGIEPDPEKAGYWYRLAARAGDAEAQYRVGVALLTGDPSDPAAGLLWLREASSQGHEQAGLIAGLAYAMRDGFSVEGLPPDFWDDPEWDTGEDSYDSPEWSRRKPRGGGGPKIPLFFRAGPGPEPVGPRPPVLRFYGSDARPELPPGGGKKGRGRSGGPGKPASGKPGSGKPASAKPGPGKRASGKPGSGKPAPAKPASAKPASGEPGADRRGPDRPDSGQKGGGGGSGKDGE